MLAAKKDDGVARSLKRAIGETIRNTPVWLRRLSQIAWDVAAWALALLILVVVRYDLALTGPQWRSVLHYGATAASLQVAVGLATKVYRGRCRTGSFKEATWLGRIVLMVGAPLAVSFPLLFPELPRGIGYAAPLMAVLFMGLGRWLARATMDFTLRRETIRGVPALVYGAGQAGEDVARLVDTSEVPPYSIVGYVDDASEKRNLRISRYRVLGKGKDLRAIATDSGAQAVIYAITEGPPSLLQAISDVCDEAGLELVVVPSVKERIGGRVTFGDLRKFNVADLLGRRPVETDLSAIADHIQGKVVLVTGAGGSIGSELAAQVHRLGPERLVLVDRDETALHGVELALYGTGMLTSDDMVLCDIRDEAALREVFQEHRPQLVFHAAALKHLPMLERFPAEGWKTNVLGTANVLKCAQEVGVTHFVNVSTDKAADASSVLGRTKRLAERLTSWYAQEHQVPYLSVRFGNVLGSRGSVLYAFQSQIEHDGPVTVTHPDVTRFFMTIPEACQLVLQAAVVGSPGDVLVLDMGEPIKIVDVARRLIAESGKQIEIRFTGLRPGEKMHEALFGGHEDARVSSHPLISRVAVQSLAPGGLLELAPDGAGWCMTSEDLADQGVSLADLAALPLTPPGDLTPAWEVLPLPNGVGGAVQAPAEVSR